MGTFGNTFSLIQGAGQRLLNLIPLKPDALVWLDGTILNNSGTYYFVDKSGNHRNFLITGYDFNTDWTKGMPYKSAATISAPTGDATLIAADLNNYWYATDGTPNQIPVVSLFQDVDYEHKFFCRHKAQVVDGNGVETYEPRVIEIVIYNTVKTGNALTLCQSYYGVPVEVTTNVKWVDFTHGSNSNTGTKLLPYLTLQYAIDHTTAGTVYIKSGLYSENNTGGTDGRLFFSAGRTLQISAIGRVKITAQSTSVCVIDQLNTAYISYSNLWLADAVKKIGIRAGTGGTANYNKLYIDNTTTAIESQYLSSSNVTNAVVVNSTNAFKYGATGYPATILFIDCLFNTAIAGSYQTGNSICNIIFANSKCAGILYQRGEGLVDVLGSEFTGSNMFGMNTSQPLLNLRVRFCKVRYIATGSTQMGTFEFTNNRLIGTGKKGVACSNSNNVKINNNIIVSSDGIAQILFDPQAGASIIEIKNNYIEDMDVVEPPIAIGNEINTNYDSVTGIIENNRVKGILDYDPLSATSPHGLTVFNNSGVIISKNFVSGVNIGLLVKTNGLNCANSGFFYNIVTNCNAGIYAKGADNIKIIGNTVTECMLNHIVLGQNTPSYLIVNATIENNIIVNTMSYSSGINAIAAESTNLISENNHVYFPNNLANSFYRNTGQSMSISAWRAMGYDINTLLSNPELTAFIPSVSILNGENLGSAYEDGLDITTNWGDASTIPVIVTKKQPTEGLWQVGAYVK